MKLLVENEYYHIYNRGTDKRLIFMDDFDRARFVKLLYLANRGGEARVFMEPIAKKSFSEIVQNIPQEGPLTAFGAYCLMPNHFHLLAKETARGGISKFMHKFTTAYAMYFNTKYKRTGRLFEGAFKASRITGDNYLRYIFSYIHLNPVKLIDFDWKTEGIKDVEQARSFLGRYPHSSYFDYSGVERPEKAVLARDYFPDYFKNPRDFSATIDDWLSYHETSHS